VIRYLVVLYLGIVSVVLIDPNPLWSLPLIIVLIGLMWEKRWISLIGIAVFSMVTVGRLEGVYLTDGLDLLMLSAAVVLPLVVLTDIVLTPRPYRVGRISLVPILAAVGMITALIIGLVVLVQFKRIGLYLESDPTLQIFLLMSLSIFLAGPLLLGSRPAHSSRKAEKEPKT
jgi:hypothetical protein